MAITIKGIRIETVSLKRDTEDGDYKIDSASYSIITSADRVLAKQTCGGYNPDTKLEPSPPTTKALSEFVSAYKVDVAMASGLEID